MSACGPVQFTTQPTSRTVPSVSVTATPPRGSGRASTTVAEATSSRPAARSSRVKVALDGAMRCRSTFH
jgi:hypothetical protein